MRFSSLKMSPFGDVEAARMLRSCAVYGYARLQWPTLQAVDVPLSCDAFSVTVLLPSGSLDELCHNLTAEVLEHVFSDLRSCRRRLVLELPVVSTETGSNLGPVLREMGVRQAFGRDAAFQRITPTSHAPLSWAMHRARLDIVARDARSIVSRAYRHVVDNITSTSGEALPDVVLLVNQPFVLCVRKLDIVVLLACIQNVCLSSP
ncbi:serpin B3-like [Amblyomma americanum]